MIEILWPNMPFGKDRMLFVVRRGSEAHGTWMPPDDPSSVDDRDVHAVAVPPLPYYFGLDEWQHAEAIQTAGDGVVWDVVVDEVRKFCRMLSRCNPNVLSALWVDPEDVLYKSAAAEALFKHRDIFLSREAAWRSFAGYAQSQFEKMKPGVYNGVMGDKRKKLVDKYGYDCKNAAHCVRLLHMGIELLRDGQVNVRRTWDREMLLDIKRGNWSIDRVHAYYNAKKSDLDRAYASSGLREQVDAQAVSELVTKVVSHFHEGGSVPAYVEPQCNRSGGHEWAADTTDVECVNCGYVKMGLDT